MNKLDLLVFDFETGGLDPQVHEAISVAGCKVLSLAAIGNGCPDLLVLSPRTRALHLLEVKAGSSGRPNRAAELANLERAMPFLLQIPGIKPEPLARKGLELIDIGVDTEDVIAEGMPSITAMNALVAKMGANPGGQPTGDPATDPNQQGGNGAQNAPGPQQNEQQQGPQPSYQEPLPIPA